MLATMFEKSDFLKPTSIKDLHDFYNLDTLAIVLILVQINNIIYNKIDISDLLHSAEDSQNDEE